MTVRMLTPLVLTGLLSACASGIMFEPQDIPVTDPSVPVVAASVETVPVGSRDDAADDPAIWYNQEDPAASRVIGTDKQAGLYVYDLSGAELQFLALPAPNNVDIRHGHIGSVKLVPAQVGGAQPVADDVRDLVVTSNRGDATVGVLEMTVDGLTELGRFKTTRPEPYGICLGLSHMPYAVVTHKAGQIDVYEVGVDNGVTGRLVATHERGTQLEGCVFDEINGTFYVGEENGGIVAFSIEGLISGNATPTYVDRIGSENGLAADIEGLTLYATGENSGYLIASSQGNNTFALYDRETRAFVGRFSIGDGGSVDGAEETDGIDALSTPMGPGFPHGMLVVQDGFNDGADTQNFKYVPWEAIAAALSLD